MQTSLENVISYSVDFYLRLIFPFFAYYLVGFACFFDFCFALQYIDFSEFGSNLFIFNVINQKL